MRQHVRRKTHWRHLLPGSGIRRLEEHARTCKAEDTLATLTARFWDNVTRPSQSRRHGKQIPGRGVRFSLLL